MRVEVLNGVERRRRWSREEKMRILAESVEPGATVADVARRNDVAQSVLFLEAGCWAHWRRKFYDIALLKKAPIASRP